MNDNESLCTKCHRRWQWAGDPTVLDLTVVQLERMRPDGTVCPHCGGKATVTSNGTLEELVPPMNCSRDPVMEVQHAALLPASPDSDSHYHRTCVRCGQGVLPVRRDPGTWALLAEDSCLLCGQRYKYLDIVDMQKGFLA